MNRRGVVLLVFKGNQLQFGGDLPWPAQAVFLRAKMSDGRRLPRNHVVIRSVSAQEIRWSGLPPLPPPMTR
jgi:hypothetical protein